MFVDPLEGANLDEFAAVYGFMRYRRFRRDWRFLWLRWRPEALERGFAKLHWWRHSFAEHQMTHEDRAAEKQASRDQDMRDLVSGKKTPAELHEENKAFRLSGAKIAFSKSRSKWW